ncbi:beta family protein [Pseudoruegeria sp. SHC-113]|uniref:beta family protein n=1 Tax=Pseudoruegeria sp. SHC-113 TaxID=2855439 RepID=UPI0021BAEA2E|nr:beta family protein [Pseudoruegeria sp. SHC-113]MCT8162100.1 beta family protein [Pseudoruegeria sp. SHC-113]
MTYHLLLKMGDSEIRAWKHLSPQRKAALSVHCEITRGRKRPNKDKSAPIEYNIAKIYSAIAEDFTECQVCVVDITREPSLRSSETQSLGNSANGYALWVAKVNELHAENAKVRPTLIVNPSEDDDYNQYETAILTQFDAFAERYDLISYRASVLHDEGFIDDLTMLADRANAFVEQGKRFEILLDFEFVQASTAPLHAAYVAPLISQIRTIIPHASIVSLGTSFPKSVTDVGDEERDEFRLEELALYEAINRAQNQPIEYGDYGSINPIRNDAFIPVGQYLRARIDFPTDKKSIYYHRVAPNVDPNTKKLISPRSSMYKAAAKRVMADASHSPLRGSWGYDKIVEAATKAPEGSSPNFWISVRMEMHICRRLDAMAQQATSSGLGDT